MDWEMYHEVSHLKQYMIGRDAQTSLVYSGDTIKTYSPATLIML